MEIGKPVRNWIVAQTRGDGGLEEAKLVKREHKQSKNPFGGRTYGIHSEPVLSVNDIPCLVLGPLRIHHWVIQQMLALPAHTFNRQGG